MRVDHINAYLNGGAAVAARRLHHGLLAAGHESRFWHADHQAADPSVSRDGTYHQLHWGMPTFRQIAALSQSAVRWSRERVLRSYYRRGGAVRPGMYNGPLRPYNTNFTPGDTETDVLHLHWVSRIIDYPSFFRSLPPNLPLVWTLHDMQPLTGGCHHAHDCNRYQHACGNCPVLGRPGEHDLSRRDHGIKQAALADRTLHIVTPSRWLEQRARASGLLPASCSFQTIRNAINLEHFRPLDKPTARRELGLPADCLLVGYAAESLSNKPKGIEEFLAAISRLAPRHRVMGLLFGKDRPPPGITTTPLINLGFLTSPEKIRLAYAAADIFTVPSHAETISQTAPEALACGTPVVASNVGGIPEVVRHGETGLLARPRDSEDLASQLSLLASDPTLRRQLAQAGLRLIRDEFAAESSIRQYLNLYERARTAARVRAGVSGSCLLPQLQVS